MEELKRELREKEEKWNRERKEILEHIGRFQTRVKEMERRGEGGKGRGKEGGREGKEESTFRKKGEVNGMEVGVEGEGEWEEEYSNKGSRSKGR